MHITGQREPQGADRSRTQLALQVERLSAAIASVQVSHVHIDR